MNNDQKRSRLPRVGGNRDGKTNPANAPVGKNPAGRGQSTQGQSTQGQSTQGRSRPTPGALSINSTPVRNVAGVVAIVALIAAIACVGWLGYRAYEAYAVQQPTQQARDDATGAAEQAMLNVTSIDPKKMDAFNQRLQSSFAGDALNQVQQQVVATLNPQLQQAGGQVGTTTSRVVRSAPTEVNVDEGTAQVLVYVAVSGKMPNQASVTPNTMGFLVGMQKFDDTWKAVKVSPLDGISYADEGSSAQQGSGDQTPAPTSTDPAGGN